MASLIDKILDTAGQKAGKWTAIAALDEGIPLTLIGEAVSRCLSAKKKKGKPGPVPKYTGDKKELIEDIRNALYASKIVSMLRAIL